MSDLPPHLSLAFGLRHVPKDARAVWGARLIWPNDLVWNRQDLKGESNEAVEELKRWLDSGRLREALAEAGRMAKDRELRSSENREVTLYESEWGVIKANPQGSYGYLYVAAWLI